MTAQVTGAHASQVMSTPVLTVELRESLWDAWQLMFVSGIRHLVVVDADGHSIGTISDRSVLVELPATPEQLGRRHVGDLISPSPQMRVLPDADPRRAADLMTEYGVEAIPVVDIRERLVGIITEADLVRWLVQ